MPTFSKPERLEAERMSVATLEYFRERLRQRLWDLVLDEFRRRERNHQFTKASFARKIRRKPEQLTRWLSAPGNWTLETLSDLLLGMGVEPGLSVMPLLNNQRMHDVGEAPREAHVTGDLAAAMPAGGTLTGSFAIDSSADTSVFRARPANFTDDSAARP